MEWLTLYRILFQAIFGLKLDHCIGLHFISLLQVFLKGKAETVKNEQKQRKGEKKS